MHLPTLPRGMFRRLATFRIGDLTTFRTSIWLAGCALATIAFIIVCLGALLVARTAMYRAADSVAASSASKAAWDIAGVTQRFDHAMQSTITRLHTPSVMSLEEPFRSLVLFNDSSGLEPLGFINVLDDTGIVTESPQPSQRGVNWAGRDYFGAQRSNPSLGLYVSRPFSRDEFASVALSRRISRDDGSFGGVVVASLRLSYFRDLITQFQIGPNGSITVTRNDGVVLMRVPFDPDAIGRSMPEQRPVDQDLHRVVVRQITGLPLTVHVSVATDDMPGNVQPWLVAALLVGAMLCGLFVASIIWLQRETGRRIAAERDNRNKSDYLAMTTNELRTPLHTILGNADRLHVTDINTVDAKPIAAIISASNHLRGVVDRVLNHLQIEQRLPTPRMARVDLNELLDECFVLIEAEATSHGLIPRYGFKAGTPEQFVTDPNLLRQILLNLLSNAVKFTARGQVAIEVGGTEERITIEVSDTGCGIPPNQRHKLFKQGERLGAERTGVPGHGLGLAMAQRLVQSMGGDIGYRESPTGGSIFWVGLPAGQLPEPTNQPACTLLSDSCRILLVEDVAAHSEIGCAALIGGGHSVYVAESGAQAVRQVRERDFDAVLIDLNLSEMDAVQATRRIRRIPGERGQVPIIGMTSSTADRLVVEALRAGVTAYLVKPFTAEQLLALLDQLVRRRPGQVAPAAVLDPETPPHWAPATGIGDREVNLPKLGDKLELPTS